MSKDKLISTAHDAGIKVSDIYALARDDLVCRDDLERFLIAAIRNYIRNITPAKR